MHIDLLHMDVIEKILTIAKRFMFESINRDVAENIKMSIFNEIGCVDGVSYVISNEGRLVLDVELKSGKNIKITC